MRYVAIDMCTIVKSAIRRVLPHATLVVDHFHLVQLANQTLTEVRRRVTVTHRGRRGRKGNREWELRNRLTRKASTMRGEHADALLDELVCLPAPIGAPITAAWHAKEDLLDLLATARTQPDREPVRATCCTGSTNAAPTRAFPSWNAEDRVRTNKATGLLNLPSQRWRVNRGWVLAANLAADPGRLDPATRALRPVRPRPRRTRHLRYRLWHLPAKLTTHARRRWLTISGTRPWRDAFTLCWQRLGALPAPT